MLAINYTQNSKGQCEVEVRPDLSRVDYIIICYLIYLLYSLLQVNSLFTVSCFQRNKFKRQGINTIHLCLGQQCFLGLTKSTVSARSLLIYCVQVTYKSTSFLVLSTSSGAESVVTEVTTACHGHSRITRLTGQRSLLLALYPFPEFGSLVVFEEKEQKCSC